MSILSRVALLALKAANPTRFKEITERNDRRYELAVELVNRGLVKPKKSKLFRSEEKAAEWAMRTHKETCRDRSGVGQTIFPTIKSVGRDWVAAVWVLDDDEIQSHFPQER
jgi:hypothetical protein